MSIKITLSRGVLTIENEVREGVSYNASNGIKIRTDACPEFSSNYLFINGSIVDADNKLRDIGRESLLKIFRAVNEYNLSLGIVSSELVQGKIPCIKCGETHSWDKLLQDKGYCKTCFDNLSFCSICNRIDPEFTFAGKYYCRDCSSINKDSTCQNCGTECDTMSRRININDNYHGHSTNIYLGECCYDKNILLKEERSWDYKPAELNFWDIVKGERQRVSTPLKRKLYMGMELECGFPEWSHINIQIQRVIDIYGAKEQILFAKHDGSCPELGTEIVTHPMTLDFIKSLTWEGYTKNTLPRNEVSETIGGHIHVAKTAFWSLAHIYRFVNFLRTNIQYCEFVGGRECDSGYCAGRATHKVTTQVKGRNNSNRYEAINFTEHTIELRFPDSPDTAEKIYKNAEFVHALWMYTINSALTFTVEDFENYVFKNKKIYNNLNNYIKARPLGTKFSTNSQFGADDYDEYDDDDERCDCDSCRAERGE